MENYGKYYEFMKLADRIARTGRISPLLTAEETEELEMLQKASGFSLEDIADANDCCGENLEIFIMSLEDLWATGERVEIR